MRRRLHLSLAVLLGTACSSPLPNVEGILVRESVCLDVHLDVLAASFLRAFETGQYPASYFWLDTACATARDCDSYLTCRNIDTTSACDPASAPYRCVDASRYERCLPSGWTETVECNERFSGGGTCFDTATQPICGTGPCTGGPRCEANVAIGCTDGIERRSDCSPLGKTCVAGPMSAVCVDIVEPCGTDRCEGDHVLDCDDGLGFNRTDCTRLVGVGGTCVSDVYTRCEAVPAECTDADAGCVGDVARHCVQGTFEEIDCSSFLNATCRDDGAGFFGRQLVCVER